ncbi:MAG: porin [Planctomycetota bacterium]|nr:porin [Planctomycetota bacterium]
MKYGLAFLTVCLFSGVLGAQEEVDPLGMNSRWNNGLEFKSNDGSVSLKLGGRIMLDHAWFADDDLSSNDDGTEFRRTRLMLQGKVNQFEWKTQYEFARGGEGSGDKGNRPAFKDVYVGVSGVPYGLGALRVGHFKEPFGLEELTSSKYITFMERSLTSAFAPSRNVGVMAHRTLDTGTLAYGVFRTTGDNGYDEGDGDYSLTGRYTRLLRNEDGGRNLLHIGAAASSRIIDGLTIQPRPSAHLAGKLPGAEDETADGEFRYGVEAAWVRGPLSVQAEFMGSSVSAADNFSYTGWYVMASYFLTGESRPYDTRRGTFKRVKPAKNFSWGESWGAVELAVRYGSIDGGDLARLDRETKIPDDTRDGPKLDDLTVGLNIYHNPTFRTMFNYVYSDMDGGEEVHAFLVRWQIGL